LFVFLNKEKATKKPIISFDRVYQKTYKALVCLTLQCTVLWMVRVLASQIDQKKELKFWTTCIIVLLKEQSMVYIHGKLLITPIIDNRHLVVQNSSIITYFFISISKINETYLDFDILIESFISLCKCLLSMIGVIIWERWNLLGKQDMISCNWMKHGLTKITCTNYMWLPNNVSWW
jgi:hypothetical protein